MEKYFLNLFKNHQNRRSAKLPNYYIDISCSSFSEIKTNEKVTLPNPIENEIFQKKSYHFFSKTKKTLSHKIYKKLNLLHKTDYPDNYWDSILGFFIEVIVGVIFQRWILLQKIKKKNFFFTTNLYRVRADNIASNSTHDFFHNFLIKNKSLIHYIDSLIIEKFKICNYVKINKFLKEENLNKNKNKNKSKKLELMFKFSKIFLKLFSSADHIFLSSINPRFILSTFLKKYKLPIFLKDPNLKYSYNNQYRDWTVDIEPKNQFETLLKNIIPKLLPRSVLEGYSTNRKFIDTNYSFKTKYLFYAVGVSDLFKILMAEKKFTGSKIINVQHGGNYGTIKRYLDETYELNHSDYFLSYGFSNKELNYKTKAKIVKLGPIDFEKKISLSIDKNKFIFILPHFTFNYLQMNSYPWTKQKFNHLNQILNLLSKLDDNIKKISEIRLNPFGKDEVLHYMKEKIRNFSYFKICDENKINFEKYSLVISLYPGTPMLQSLYKDIPTIICFPLKYFKLNNQGISSFNKLKEDNIFIDDSIKLASFLNNVKFNPKNWWTKKNVRFKIKKLRSIYCINDQQVSRMNKFISILN